MAIIKNTLTKHGIQAEYWKLMSANIDGAKNLVTLNLALYASADARDAGAIPLWNEQVHFKLSELSVNPLSVLYPLLTETDLLKDGVADTEAEPALRIQHIKPESNTPVPPVDMDKLEALSKPKPTFGAQ